MTELFSRRGVIVIWKADEFIWGLRHASPKFTCFRRAARLAETLKGNGALRSGRYALLRLHLDLCDDGRWLRKSIGKFIHSLHLFLIFLVSSLELNSSFSLAASSTSGWAGFLHGLTNSNDMTGH